MNRDCFLTISAAFERKVINLEEATANYSEWFAVL